MGVPLVQQYRIGKFLLAQRLKRRKKYSLVLMLEPLFRCNLACAGCGKIDYPDETLAKQLSLEECLAAVDECGAPVVSIPGGEPLLHPEMPQIVEGIVARKKFVYLCTNALLLEKHMDRYTPSTYLTFSVHLDGMQQEHDLAVCQEGVFDRAVKAIQAVLARGFRVTINCTLFDNADPEKVAEFLDYARDLGVESVTISPGFNYERAPRKDVFLKRNASKQLFRDIFRLGKARKRGSKWRFNQSSLFLDFLAGNQTYECTPWGNATRNIFGWQKPCYLLVGEGYAPTYKALLEETDWDSYGVGKNEKCSQCQVHCGFEPTAVDDTLNHPLRALRVALFGPRTEGPFAPDLAERMPLAQFSGSPAESDPAAPETTAAEDRPAVV